MSAAQSFGRFVRLAHEAGELVVQPRMGMSDPVAMKAGLRATRAAAAVTVGTITLDSYTRVGRWASAAEAVESGAELNGYPIATHPLATTREVLADVGAPASFPVQVRHGSAQPEAIVESLVAAGLSATEGGPVSYCLPYGRVPLADSIASWKRACRILTRPGERGAEPHLETFGGCLLGQLCPPSLLLAVSVLEGMFFAQQGIGSISLSYAQQTNHDQDVEAVLALHRLAARFLPGLDVHVVLYAYMGVYPRTTGGADLLLSSAARLATQTGAARLIVKTAVESQRIPSIGENVRALELAAGVARNTPGPTDHQPQEPPADTGIHEEAGALIEAVLDLSDDVGTALHTAFARGHLDIPFCLHPDNAGRSRSRLEADGRLTWSRVGSLPLAPVRGGPALDDLSSAELLKSLTYLERTFDEAALVGA
jgi:methylaspartate mutase epsilon subunit